MGGVELVEGVDFGSKNTKYLPKNGLKMAFPCGDVADGLKRAHFGLRAVLALAKRLLT